MKDNSVSPNGFPGSSPSSLYKRASRALGVTAFLAALAVGLLFLLPGGLAWAQDAGPIEYPENGTGAVATFTAEDPEGKSVTWSVLADATGLQDIDEADVANSGLFSIDESSGVLTFKDAPDYETPLGGPSDNSNTYMLVVQVSDGAEMSWKKVEVEVTNEEEEATTNIELSSLQPQVSTDITVAYVDGVGNPFVNAEGVPNTTIVDPDKGKSGSSTIIPTADVKWQWSKSASRDGTYTDIPGDSAKEITYTPDSTDANRYLRVTATYEDGEGEGKSVEATSAYPVRTFRSGNSDPAFPEDFDDEMGGDNLPMGKVDDGAMEGDAVGDPVTANEPNNDRLTYSLEAFEVDAAADADVFQIDRMTGQVSVGLGKKVSPVGDTDEPDAVVKKNSFMVTIKATDPSGLTDTVEMTITVTAKDEDPVFTMGKLSHEHKENGTAAVYTFAAYDPEGVDVAYSLSGDDAGKFTITIGALAFRSEPNFEMPGSGDGDNTYEVMVKAAAISEGEGATEQTTTLAVMVEVTNVDDLGTVSLSATQPRIGVEITANDPVDEDGMVSDVTWQWSKADAATFGAGDTVTEIKGATMASYTPVTADENKFLRATASYTDAQGDGKTVAAISGQAVQKTRNLAPVFTDEDTAEDSPGIQVKDRQVAENAGNGAEVGDPVLATDTVDADETDNRVIVYRLSGGDTDSFTIVSTNGVGQIQVGANAMLDYETKKSYMVTVTALDLEGLNSSIDVTIEVTAVDEAPEIMTGPSSTEYPENGTGAVATFTAEDPEGKSVTWSVLADATGLQDIDEADVANSGLFSIDESSGVLTFKDAPDYETPLGGPSDNSNTYMLVVQVSDGAEMSWKKVEVEVTNEEEEATTNIELSSLQPQVSTDITVAYVDGVGNPFVNAEGVPNTTIVDPDKGKSGSSTIIPTADVKWQWSKSASRDGTYTDIPGDSAKEITYTPDSTDANRYLRVTATYEDGEGEGKSVEATSAYPVRTFRSGNSDPAFPEDFDDEMGGDNLPMGKVDDGAMEGDAVGDPVTANEPNNDRLTYSLEAFEVDAAADADVFQIDRMTGQVSVGLGKKVSPVGDTDEPDAVVKKNSFMVTIKATDPSGLTDTVEMTITVTAKDEDPVFTMGKLSHEHKENGTAAVYTFAAYDPEGVDVAYSLSGDDAGKFTITIGALAFRSEPNFEMPGSGDGDNTYEVMVKAAAISEGEGATEQTTTLAVMVEVTNVDDLGTVSLSATQPRIGVEITANDPVDEDGMVSDVTWQWSKADAATFGAGDTVTEIKGATMASYTPVTADENKFLRATASYTDAQGDGKTVAAISGQAVQKTRNLAPVFTDEDTAEDSPGIQVKDRQVAENAGNGAEVGDPVLATDTVDADETDNRVIVYRLSGGDTDSFTIVSTNGVGQIQVGANAMLDYETKKSYMVTVTALDLEGLNSSIDVTIEVTDVDEAPEIMRAPDANVAPEFASATTRRTVAENTATGEDIDNPVVANDANGDAPTYALSGTDAASFDIDPDTGQLTTLAALDYETKDTYSVTVTASDSGGLSDSIDVTITVTNVDEPGAVKLSSEALVVGTALTANLTDDDGETTEMTWQWASSDAMDGTFTPIEGAMSSIYTPVADDVGKHLRATASYTDGEGSGKSERATSANMVTAADTRDPLLAEYDPNADGVIEKADMRRAVGLFFGSQPTLSRTDMRRLVGIYFS